MISPFIKDVPFFGATDEVLKHTNGAFQELKLENLVTKQVLRPWQILSKHVGSTLSTMMINPISCIGGYDAASWCTSLFFVATIFCSRTFTTKLSLWKLKTPHESWAF